MEETILTPEGLKELEEELALLREGKRMEVAEQLAQARELGGELSDNSDYLLAKQELELLEQRIALLEGRLRTARVLDATKIRGDVVDLGTTVRLRELPKRQASEYVIVGAAEANPAEGKLSAESPVGQAILGHKKGETVEVEAPSGRLKYKITDVRAA